MTFLEILVLSVVEGLTEFLPVSSTGHLVLSAKLLGIAIEDFVKTFEISIQLGAILAVVFLYGRTVFMSKAIMQKVLVGFIPTGIIGLAFYGTIKQFLESPYIVIWALGVGGIFIILFERLHRRISAEDDISVMSYGGALKIGLFQSISMIPGVSRAAATIIGGEISGLSRRAAVEFSFLLALPTMGAATALDLYKNAGSFSGAEWGQLAMGVLISFCVAVVAIRFLLRYIRTHDLSIFGWYRIVLAVVFWLFVL